MKLDTEKAHCLNAHNSASELRAKPHATNFCHSVVLERAGRTAFGRTVPHFAPRDWIGCREGCRSGARRGELHDICLISTVPRAERRAKNLDLSVAYRNGLESVIFVSTFLFFLGQKGSVYIVHLTGDTGLFDRAN